MATMTGTNNGFARLDMCIKFAAQHADWLWAAVWTAIAAGGLARDYDEVVRVGREEGHTTKSLSEG